MPAAAQRAEEKPEVQKERTMSRSEKNIEPPSKYRAIGMLYAKEEDGVIGFRVLYTENTPAILKERIAEVFGVGALEWRTGK